MKGGDIMDITQMTQLATNIGFPIFVAIYTMYLREKDNQNTQELIKNNTETMQKVVDAIDELKSERK